ncbi:MAG: TRM11 family SAM-dependent methyltransferase [Nocardioides sp.]
MRYLIQFPAGATALAERAVLADFANAKIEYGDDSALVFESSSQLQSAHSVPYAKNVFAIHAQTPRRNALASSVSRLATAIPNLRDPRNPPGFRLMYHIDGQLVSCDPRARQALERSVATASGLRLTPRGQCQEFWIIGRRELEVLYFGQRLRDENPPTKAKGALSVELSALLVAASEPSSTDVFLDPFAGSGALVLARLRSPAKSITYSDLALRSHRTEFAPALARNRKVKLLAEDAFELPSIRTGSVDVVVTDPPWGEHDREIGDYGNFADQMAASFARVLKPQSGRAVVLVNRRNEEVLTKALVAGGLDIYDTTQLLVNGHPASAVRARI